MDDLPLAVRRPRRSCTSKPEVVTPRKTKRVRFSDPGPCATGLTPLVNRASLTTPSKRRRVSIPSRSTGNGVPSSPLLPESGDVTFLPLRQVLDGRIQRRLRRNGLSEEMNVIHQEKKHRDQCARKEVEQLKSALKARDREIYELQNATFELDTDRIWDLEQQVEELKAQLDKRSREHSRNWTLASPDPYSDDMDITADEHFGDMSVAQLECSTPSRARSSFPTPPATSPTLPATPCSALPTPSSHAGVQVTLPDPRQQQTEEELASLQLEVCKLTTTLDHYKALASRLSERMPQSDSPTEDLEKQLDSLLQTMSDRTAALTHLASSISDLGFDGEDASDMITSLASGFRAARLELEYLTPGELTIPLTSHGAQVLDLLLTRLRDLAKKVKEDEDAIDEYHEIEQSLRKQLDARVSVLDDLKAEMHKAQRLLNEKNLRIQELQVGNDRLRGAMDGYIRDVAELERLVERMEQDSATQQQGSAEKDTAISHLESKLAGALKKTAQLQAEMSSLEDKQTSYIARLNKQHGAGLALRDARVTELRDEIDRVNASMRAAHETIRVLRVDKGRLTTAVDQEKRKATEALDAMKAELQRALEMNGPPQPKTPGTDSMPSSPLRNGSAVKEGFLAGDLARRASKKRRRYDSGLGFLDEDED